VAAGGVARLVIPEVTILAYVSEIGGDAIDMANFDEAQIRPTPSSAPTPPPPALGKDRGRCARSGSSVGAVVECVATGVPAGWGAPIYAKLDPTWPPR
jgi:chorismate synthase